jgi:very-short-patch-repair endonuclease
MTAGSTFHMDETGGDVFIEIDDLVLFFSHFFASIRPWGSFPEHACHRSCHRFQALIKTDWKFRNKYSQKYCDFAICSPSFFVIAVIELDDRTHNGKKTKDAERDEILESAGIRTIRYRQIPEPEQVKKDVLPTITTPAQPSNRPTCAQTTESQADQQRGQGQRRKGRRGQLLS